MSLFNIISHLNCIQHSLQCKQCGNDNNNTPQYNYCGAITPQYDYGVIKH